MFFNLELLVFDYLFLAIILRFAMILTAYLTKFASSIEIIFQLNLLKVLITEIKKRNSYSLKVVMQKFKSYNTFLYYFLFYDY